MRKEAGKTSSIERFNNTLRQRCSQFMRKAFSNKLTNLIGMIIYFICNFNRRQALYELFPIYYFNLHSRMLN
ncbi:putative transposase [Candidatus Protochlamydia amoebophila]|uniref:Putative transposase n=1 Tax=Candidatus Protochlamydia amoebophila TaxID=362787 RepID=A0A0C1JK57_9BACT|nr:putative transposase [Candidatus Protochlamydia amoebophila]